MKKVKCIFAPNVHTGGGFTLLKMLIPLFSGNKVNLVLDERGKPKLPESIQNVASFFHPTILGRLRAELRLFQITGVNEVLCFHSLPPLMPFKGNVYVFFKT